MVLLVLSGCTTGTRPKWEGSIYFGDAAKEGVTRTGEKPGFISVKEPDFDGMVCIPRDDFKSFTHTFIEGCREWRER